MGCTTLLTMDDHMQCSYTQHIIDINYQLSACMTYYQCSNSSRHVYVIKKKAIWKITDSDRYTYVQETDFKIGYFVGLFYPPEKTSVPIEKCYIDE